MSIAEGIVLQIFLLDLFSVIGNLKKNYDIGICPVFFYRNFSENDRPLTNNARFLDLLLQSKGGRGPKGDCVSFGKFTLAKRSQ